MKNEFFLIIFLFFLLPKISFASDYKNFNGKIFLQVEENGEAWYIYPKNHLRYYLGRPDDAFAVMKKLGLGAKNDFIFKNDIFPQKVSGMILLDVEKNGEAYYINPKDRKKYYLGRPEDAFSVMKNLGVGINNKDLEKIKIGEFNGAEYFIRDETENIILDVPFSSQAPFGEWNDERQQDGCEEISSLMAVSWAKEEDISKESAREEVIKSSVYQFEKYGEYRDVSAKDTLDRIIKDYFNYEKAFLRKNILKEDIISELEAGNVIIAPVNGRILKNPYYTAPGPERHMLLVRGYDSNEDVFITNDPGTRHGEAYEYNTDRFYYSIRDYKTGYREEIGEIEKNIIVISKQ